MMIETMAALAAVEGIDVATLAAVSWHTECGEYASFDVAIVERDTWQAWWPKPHLPPPRVLWWVTARSSDRVRDDLSKHGIHGLGPHALPEPIAAPLRAHVRAPRPVACSHCGAPVKTGNECRYCGTRR